MKQECITTKMSYIDNIQTWDEFFIPFTQYLEGEVWGDEYSKFREYSDKYGINVDVILKVLLDKNFDAQEGLDKLFLSLIEGHRYAYEIINSLQRLDGESCIIKEFIRHGAKINYDILFKSYTDVYDEYVNAYVQALLIDLTHQYGLDASKYADWKSIQSTHWEEADSDLDNKLIEKMTLKYSSMYLQTL